ncbi:MAG: hypothetical protein RI922_1115 [Bacteroidota bacterium]|jgi:bilirubin oxidase
MTKFTLIASLIIGFGFQLKAQNPLFIPPTLTGTTFNLNVQTGTQNFFPSNPTPTYGINGPFLSPTIIVNKGDVVTLNVNNGLPVATTMHWHGLHVAPENDGGPHQSIAAGTTWSPSFEILNQAGTFWYHPHGDGKTDLHVSKGLAGLFIVHDADELAAGLPITYGVDDIPIIVQTKAFDVLNQIAIADHMDTALFVNGTLDPQLTVPAQVVRFRLLNGSSMRSFDFGLSNNQVFYQVATDAGLRAAPLALTRLRLSPGERAEILVDFSALQGQQLDLMSFSSEMDYGIFGGPGLGAGMDTIHGYSENPLNGTDFTLVSMTVGAPTAAPVTSIPSALVPFVPFDPINADVHRTLVLDTIRLLPTNMPSLVEGPFGFNGETFDMGVINMEIPLNSTEVWTLVNKTLIAHPFHLHDVAFNVIEKNGTIPSPEEQGWKDVILVMPNDSVKFITKFITFSDEMMPYMYHCHLLHHEDDGMMGSFLVIDPNAGIVEKVNSNSPSVFPNPSTNRVYIRFDESADNSVDEIRLLDLFGRRCDVEIRQEINGLSIDVSPLSKGIYNYTILSADQENSFQGKIVVD